MRLLSSIYALVFGKKMLLQEKHKHTLPASKWIIRGNWFPKRFSSGVWRVERLEWQMNFWVENKSSPSFCFLNAPFPKLLFAIGRFHPRQLLHRLSGSELQLHSESSSNRSESSKVYRSSSFHSGWASGGCCWGCCAGKAGDARWVRCCPGGSPTASPPLASASS